jgi:diguanylate cyclase (GGDEF)-like protein/putative nucleotidyltransferase with HDIG domain
MERLLREWLSANRKIKTILLSLVLISIPLLLAAAGHAIMGPPRELLLLLAFAIIICVGTAAHPVQLPGIKAYVSASEAVIFLSAILQGPFYATILGAIDGVVASHKIAKKRIYVITDGAILGLSAFISASAYGWATAYLASASILEGPGHELEMVVLPLVIMAMVHYVSNIGLTAVFTKMGLGLEFATTWRETYPWIPVTYLASAGAAGIVGYAFSSFDIISTLLVMMLVVPVPLIIYFTFKAYNSKIQDERRHMEEVNEIHRSTLEALAMAIDAKDQTTHSHIRRVQIYARRLGENMGLSEKEQKALEAASLLHDIGKLGVPDYILNKPGKLTEYEFNKMKIHPVVGAEILSNVKFDFPVAAYVRAHHERWDGRGYPDGLKGEEIPLGARILALVDHFDALHSERPYRKALTRQEAIGHIKSLSGIFFDPSLVKLFLEGLNEMDAEIALCVTDLPDTAAHSHIEENSSAPAAGYAEERGPLTQVALSRIAAAHQEVSTLHDIARVLSSSLSLQDTVAIITSRIANLVPYSTCVIYLLDAGKTIVRAEYASGLHKEMFRGRTFRVGEGITGWVIANHRPMYNTSPLLDLSFLGGEIPENYRAVVVFPAIRDGETIGAVALYSTELVCYTEEHLRLLDMIMQPVSDALHNALLFENARQTALTDLLTGLPNMRAFSVHFDRELSAAARSDLPMSILVIDLNDFKKVNDTHGHMVGDRVLAQIGRTIRGQLRDIDLIARYAGDEFVVLLPMTDYDQAGFVVNRIQNAIGDFAFMSSEGAVVTITASIGAATIPGDGHTFEELMMQADKRMYRTKDDVKARARATYPQRIALSS